MSKPWVEIEEEAPRGGTWHPLSWLNQEDRMTVYRAKDGRVFEGRVLKAYLSDDRRVLIRRIYVINGEYIPDLEQRYEEDA